MSFPFVGIQLDLKYVMPRLDYLNEWVRELAASGINTLLLEYEDKFPFEKYPFLRDREAFTPEQLRNFLKVVRGAGMRVIPLVQTLSHLEFALAHDELAHLRERDDIPTQINLANPDAQAFVRDLIDEVVAYHEEDEFFHLGADETWFLGADEGYAELVKEHGVIGVWVRHMKPLCEEIIARGKRPIVWDDVFWPDPESIGKHGLPLETVIGSWNYSTTKLNPDGSTLSRVDAYRRAGFEVIGVPCLNWGILYPMHDHCLQNTAAWVGKARQSGLLGLINSAWAVFHTPLPTHLLFADATVRLLENEQAMLPNGWEEKYLAEHYGTSVAGIVDALRALGTNWELIIEGIERPLSPVVYSYMDLVIHYQGGQDERRRRGSYPLDWNEIDFPGLLRKKLDLIREFPDQVAIRNKLEELETTYRRANTILTRLVENATKNQEEARLLAVFARLKAAHVKFLQYMLFDVGSAATVYSALQPLGKELASALEPFLQPASVRRSVEIWWQPAMTVIEEEK